ncbi:MAG: hypothetical protein IPH72_34615 [Sandaracinaceae bacterium]|nr:hypothetical protein [Sandaracinaceae bacterium]
MGSAWGTPSDGETPVIPVYAPPGEPLAEVTLPEGAFGFRMADGRHGIALGETLDKVWVSTDGARSWERLTLPGTGDVAGVELPVSRGGSFARTPARRPRVPRARHLGGRPVGAVEHGARDRGARRPVRAGVG